MGRRRRPLTTAQIFHEKLQEHLGAHPDVSISKVAKFLGISRQGWHQYLTGNRNPSEKTINTWLTACREAGIDVPDSVRGALLYQMNSPAAA